ncbi:hypothetical protein [Rhodococcus sp. (in: high G+C Gram-positive bacteria)]
MAAVRPVARRAALGRLGRERSVLAADRLTPSAHSLTAGWR